MPRPPVALLVFLLVMPLLLAACTAEVAPGRVELEPAPVKVTIGGGGGFCPPGQAMKGRC
jgi:hypothetical protein